MAIDFHGGQGQIETDRQIVSNPALFEQNWVALVAAIQSLPTFQQNIRGKACPPVSKSYTVLEIKACFRPNLELCKASKRK